jgi:hypothetical protein
MKSKVEIKVSLSVKTINKLFAMTGMDLLMTEEDINKIDGGVVDMELEDVDDEVRVGAAAFALMVHANNIKADSEALENGGVSNLINDYKDEIKLDDNNGSIVVDDKQKWTPNETK